MSDVRQCISLFRTRIVRNELPQGFTPATAMKPKLITGVIAAGLLASFTGLARSTPCPTLDGNPENLKQTAEWVVEGTIVAVENTGTFGDCEMLPTRNGLVPQCANVNLSERIKLVNAIYTLGENNAIHDGEVSVVRKAHCFSGSFSSMNAKPELHAVGKRVRFYGNATSQPPYIQAGYFWVEVLP